MKKIRTSVLYVKYYMFFGYYFTDILGDSRKFKTVKELKDYFNRTSAMPVKFINVSMKLTKSEY